ncbi:MAG: hypothetical protein RBU29_00885 [bacterium]|nr:hypothetical protein [bacterium]
MNDKKTKIIMRVLYASIFTVVSILFIMVLVENKELMKLIEPTPKWHLNKLFVGIMAIGIFNFSWALYSKSLADLLSEILMQVGLWLLFGAFVWPKLFPIQIGEETSKKFFLFNETTALYSDSYSLPLVWSAGAILLGIGIGRVLFSEQLNKE